MPDFLPLDQNKYKQNIFCMDDWKAEKAMKIDLLLKDILFNILISNQNYLIILFTFEMS